MIYNSAQLRLSSAWLSLVELILSLCYGVLTLIFFLVFSEMARTFIEKLEILLVEAELYIILTRTKHI